MTRSRPSKRLEPQLVDMAPTFRYLSDEMAQTVLQAQQRGCGSHIPPHSRWYCFQAHAGAEYVAIAELGRQGFVTHVPMFVDRQRRPMRNGKPLLQPPLILPLFPGYGFVAFDVGNDRWRSVCSTRGVKRLFQFSAERPMPVPTGVVEELTKRCCIEGYIDDDKPPHQFSKLKRGTKVRILDGAFEGLIGVCSLSSSQRVDLLLEIMGRHVPTTVERRSVVAVG